MNTGTGSKNARKGFSDFFFRMGKPDKEFLTKNLKQRKEHNKACKQSSLHACFQILW